MADFSKLDSYSFAYSQIAQLASVPVLFKLAALDPIRSGFQKPCGDFGTFDTFNALPVQSDASSGTKAMVPLVSCGCLSLSGKFAVAPHQFLFSRLQIQVHDERVWTFLHPRLTHLHMTYPWMGAQRFGIKLRKVLQRIRLHRFTGAFAIQPLRFPDGEEFGELIQEHLDQFPSPSGRSEVRLKLQIPLHFMPDFDRFLTKSRRLLEDTRVHGEIIVSMHEKVPSWEKERLNQFFAAIRNTRNQNAEMWSVKVLEIQLPMFMSHYVFQC